jgi:hypothetical protein
MRLAGLRWSLGGAVRRFGTLARAAAPLTVSVPIAWALHEALDGSFSLFFWLPAAFLLWHRRWASVVLFLPLTPLAFAVFAWSVEYVSGSPTYVNGPDVIWAESGSIDPITRVRGRHPGCGTRSANSWVRSTAKELAVVVMHPLFGPPPGAYTGPYPTLAQALAALRAGGVEQQPANLEAGVVRVGNAGFTVDPSSFHCHYQTRAVPTPLPAPHLAPTAVLWKGTCLIVRVPRDVDPGPWADVYVFDTITAEPFAMYNDASPFMPAQPLDPVISSRPSP